MRIEITKDSDLPDSWMVMHLHLEPHGPHAVMVHCGDVIVGEIVMNQVETVREMQEAVRRAKRLEMVPRYVSSMLREIVQADSYRSKENQFAFFKGVVAALCGKEAIQQNPMKAEDFNIACFNHGHRVGDALVKSAGDVFSAAKSTPD